jgi:hypothetical protein
MYKPGIVCSILLLLAAAPAPTYSQQSDTKQASAPVHYYQLRFDIEEVGDSGKIINTRTYMTVISAGTHESGFIRTGNKVPVITGSVTNANTENKQVQYLDVGVNIDAGRANDVGNDLAMQVKAEVSSVVSGESSVPSRADDPVIRQNSWDSDVLVTPGKPKVIFSSDNLDNKGRLQVELTATRIE